MLLLLLSHLCPALLPHGCSTPGSSPWDSPGKSTRVGCHFLLQGLFLIQGSNPGLLHCRQLLYCLSHRGGPNISISELWTTSVRPHSTQSSNVQAPGLEVRPGKISTASLPRAGWQEGTNCLPALFTLNRSLTALQGGHIPG